MVRDWAKTLFLPYVKEAYHICREQHIAMPSPPPSPTLREILSNNSGEDNDNGNGSPGGVGHLSFLNQYLSQKKTRYEWKYDSIHEDDKRITPMWRAKLMVEGKRLAGGKGVTKKVAQNDAARDALKALGVSLPGT